METYYKILISELHKGVTKKGESISGYLNFENNRISFTYSEPRKQFIFKDDYKIDLTTTACNYGGIRYWFICPHCGDRKTILFYNKVLACRQCIGNNYKSLTHTKTDSFYYFEQAKQVARKVDSTFDWGGWIGNGVFPKRPKHMHYETYFKLHLKYTSYFNKGHERFLGRVGRLEKMNQNNPNG